MESCRIALGQEGFSPTWLLSLFSGVGLIVAGISHYAITIFDSPFLLMICYAMEAAFVSFLVAVMPQVVMTAMPGKPGTIIGFAMMIGSFSGVVGPLISGKIIEASGATQGGFGQAFLLCGVICVIAGILVTLFTKPEAKKMDQVHTT
ncbi:MFS transporter [Brevibacillus invocatus]|uniref:MFS transporter n=1 Tax=Brevibacillus invocatus TaxID=173959 RepID=A0A3M8CHC4_9BACL|nr:MFS transporter [Brevibacillus invocatus]